VTALCSPTLQFVREARPHVTERWLARLAPDEVALASTRGEQRVLEIRVLDETERLVLWQRALAAAGLWVRDAAGLVARYRIGPGVIHRAIASVRPATAMQATRSRRTSARRVMRGSPTSIAPRPGQTSCCRPTSSIALVGRVRHRRQVYEQWGMGETLATSRGITALFSGPPGTGKTLVAGVIARELGLDLYQVDLSKVMSFPDEDLPPQLPIAGELAFDKLARKYQLSGGYIRNACVRAAFLAAQEETALDQAHLERAVALEFAELGKLSSSGALE
jgi:hypothetical protein